MTAVASGVLTEGRQLVGIKTIMEVKGTKENKGIQETKKTGEE
jgi:hypothetical protein